VRTKQTAKLADEVWIATALLHLEHPERPDFTIKEIEERLRRENITGEARKGIYPHVFLHCVANVPANPGRYRILVATAGNRRRLFTAGDAYDPSREGGKAVPKRTDIPSEYHYLLDWYEAGHESERGDPLLALRGAGADLWRGEAADAYVRRLREGWE